MEALLQDIRHAFRRISKNPAFAAIALLTLGLGIGANTAIFSLADLIIRRPVDLPEMDSLVVVDEQLAGSENRGISPANYLDLGLAATSFKQLSAYEYWSVSEDTQGQPHELQGVRVSANFFATIGVSPILGRVFAGEDTSSLKEGQIVISNALWKQRFGSAASAVGQPLTLDGKLYTVIGVMPPRATFPLGAPAFWMPLTVSSRMRSERSGLSLRAVGRLRAGVSLAQARSEVDAIWRRFAELYPDANRDRTIEITSLHDSIVLDYNRQFALLLMGLVGMVLLIACTNMSAVQFARAFRRRSEIAVRAALGASRHALLRQFLVENMLLAIGGGAFGVLLAIYGVAILRRTLPSDVRWFCDVDSLRVNTSSLLFTTGVTIAAGMFSGLAPAWRSSKADLSGVLAENAARIASRRSHFWRAALVVTETAMATVLLIAAALMTKGFALLARGHSDLSPASLLTFHVTLPQDRYSGSERIQAFEENLLDQIRRLPNVRAAALASGIPYSSYENDSQITAQDSWLAGPRQQVVAMVDSVSPEYLAGMQIPLRAGRQFSPSDSAVSSPVCIVSQSMAQRVWPGQSALGKRLKMSSNGAVGKWITVVGIATDVQHEIYDRSFRSILYLPYTQNPPRSADFVIRAEGDPLQFATAARAAVRKLDPSLPVEDLQTLSGLIRSQASALEYVAGLMSAFAMLGLILAFVGVYGVMANSVAERWRELAIRMALGARSWRLLLTVIGRAFLFSAMGMAFGLFLSLSLARLLASLIYGVSAWDAGTFISIPLLLATIALLACYAPARRAVRMDPMLALRYE